MSSREYEHLNDLSQVRFLVIDEADRMITQGSFPQLSMILDAVQRANPGEEDDKDKDETNQEPEDENLHDEHRLLGLPGVPGEAKLMMLNDTVLAEIQRQGGLENNSDNDKDMLVSSSEQPPTKELEDSDYEEQQAQLMDMEQVDRLDDQLSLPADPPVQRQTFVYSATLTLPASANFNKSKRQIRYSSNVGIEGAIAEILTKSRAQGKTKVIDLSNINHHHHKPKARALPEDKKESTQSETFRLPEGLSLLELKCTQRHKDSHLYAYLMTTHVGSSGPCLVFCNSIAGVRRVGATLQALGLNVRILHAHMQQVRHDIPT